VLESDGNTRPGVGVVGDPYLASAASLRRAALVTVVVGQFAVQLGMAPVTAFLPTLADVFETEFTLVSWIVGAYLVSLTGFILVAGRLGDLYGHRRIYAAGIAVFAGAGVLCGFALNIVLMILLRAIQGFGGALLLGNGLAILANAFPMGERGRAVGVAQVAAELGRLLGLAHTNQQHDAHGWE
jgi:MFS transporter, DHA2 family, methylenomycin A resistance protein